MYKYKKLVNAVRTTGSGTKVFVTGTANTLEKAQIEKLSNAAEKGDKIFLNIFFAARDHGQLSSLYTVYNLASIKKKKLLITASEP